LASRENWRRWGDKSAIAVAAGPSPVDEAKDAQARAAAEEFIRRIDKMR